MRIENLRHSRAGDRARIEARFVYEDAPFRPVDVYYEVGPPLADALEATPEAFVLAGFAIALWEGEQRLRVEGALDASLLDGLRHAESLLATWYERCGRLVVEPTEGLRKLEPRPASQPVALFSGGVDAFAMLRENRDRFPLDHPESIRTVAYAFGFSFLDRKTGVEDAFMRARYEAQARRLDSLGERVGLDVARVDTNVRLLDPTRAPFYWAASSGAFLAPLVASVGFVSDALMASAGEATADPTPHGSHPLLDIRYSTGAVRVHHMQPELGRSSKIRMISDWEPAFDTLQVCHGWLAPTADVANCGKCEKCMRTMVALVACEALPRFGTFPVDDVTTDMIDEIKIRFRNDYLTAPNLIDGLERVGRGDLVRAIRSQADRLPDRQAPGPNGVWRRRLARGIGPLRLRER